MGKVIRLSDFPGFRDKLRYTEMAENEKGEMEEYESDEDAWTEDEEVVVLSQGDMSDLVDAYKMIQDGLDKVKEITGIDYEEGAFNE